MSRIVEIDIKSSPQAELEAKAKPEPESELELTTPGTNYIIPSDWAMSHNQTLEPIQFSDNTQTTRDEHGAPIHHSKKAAAIKPPIEPIVTEMN